MGTKPTSDVADISRRHQDRIIAVATIVAPHGINGWVKLHADFGPPDLLDKVSPWLLSRQDKGGDWQETRAEKTRVANGRMQAKLPGVDGRDEAEALVGMTVGVTRSLMPALPEGEYYWCDLVGLLVIGEAKEPLGKVARVLSTPAHDMLEIASSAGDDLLIPFKDPYIVSIDFEAGKLLTRWQPDY